MTVLKHLPIEARRPPSRESYDLSDGGLVGLLLGPGDDVPTDYALHPQVRPNC